MSVKMAKKLQERVASDGMIVGTVDSVRSIIMDIVQDPRFRTVEAVYSERPNPKPSKEPGTPYTITVARPPEDATKGVLSEEESVRRLVDNENICLYCVDTPRRRGGHGAWRTPKVRCLRSIQVYVDRNGETETVEIPIHIIDPLKAVKA